MSPFQALVEVALAIITMESALLVVAGSAPVVWEEQKSMEGELQRLPQPMESY